MCRLFVVLLLVAVPAPVTQGYELIFVAADPEGAVRNAVTAPMSSGVTAGSTFSGFVTFTPPPLASGLYRLQVIIIGDNGIGAISQPFHFRYCNPSCTP